MLSISMVSWNSIDVITDANSPYQKPINRDLDLDIGVGSYVFQDSNQATAVAWIRL